MRLPVHNSSSGRNNIKVMIVAALFLSLLLPLGQGQSANGSMLLIDDPVTDTHEGEFPKDFDDAKEQYHHTINCFFNVAVDKHIEIMNKKYKDDTKNEAQIERPDLGDCKSLPEPIQKYYMEKLEKILGAIDKNVADASKKADEEPVPPAPNPARNLCNIENIDGKNGPMTQLKPSNEDEDYFAFEQKTTISPTYAVALVSNCYLFVYKQYLSQRINQTTNVSQIAEEEGQTSMSQEFIATLHTKRRLEAASEMTRSEGSLDLALASLEEMIQTYPLHIRYQEIIDHSEKLRDQFARIRVPLDQLQYKLVNQSTKSCE